MSFSSIHTLSTSDKYVYTYLTEYALCVSLSHTAIKMNYSSAYSRHDIIQRIICVCRELAHIYRNSRTLKRYV